MRENSAFLVLEDGTVYGGRSFGAPAPAVEALVPLDPGAPVPSRFAGEVVFNTAMSGYHEVLTDPSYTGQLVTMTYPHIGNYGDLGDWSEVGPEGDVQREQIKAAGFVVRSVYRGPVPDGRVGLSDFLAANGTPGISEVDTRALTLRLREKGSLLGVITAPTSAGGAELSARDRERAVAFLKSFPQMVGRNLIREVGIDRYRAAEGIDGAHFALLDCGSKANIVRELQALGCRVSLFPSSAEAEAVLDARPDAVIISNGPGDPAVLTDQIETIRSLIGRVPTFGICLGHQLIGLALGAQTYKMKFGHHGVNHPVRDERTKRVFVTSQNHGFAVNEKTLPAGTDVWFRNANDGSVEGLINEKLRIMCAQFHPESAPGPRDSTWIFREFLNHI
ncbi:glutamine-hydrolyzing carbamoyl-phosphate synthase small subunit [Salinispira pacifica]